MSAHAPASITRVAPDQPQSNWASWLRDIARLLNLVTYLVDRPPLTFATLPTDATAGTQAYITDGSVTGWGAAAAGGGTTAMLVWYNGATWKVLGV